MKQQKKKFKKEKILERSEEIKKHFKIKENLKLLNKYVRHIRTHSTGLSFHRSTRNYDNRKKLTNRLYRGFEKARTPKHSDSHEIDFKRFLVKNDPTSDPNLRGYRDEVSSKSKINVDTQSK